MKKTIIILILLSITLACLFAQAAAEVSYPYPFALQLNEDGSFVEVLDFKDRGTVVYEGTYSFDSESLTLNAQTPVVRQFVFGYNLRYADGNPVLDLNWDSQSVSMILEKHSSNDDDAHHIWKYDWVEISEPTCADTGTKECKCIICGLRMSSSIPANGHSKVDGVCTVCGSSSPYLVSRSGYLKVDDPSMMIGIIEVPGEVDGKTVLGIDSNGFENCKDVTSIILPNSVTLLNYQAFAGCEKLAVITIPISVTRISFAIFKNCIALESINYSGTMEQWNSIDKSDNWMGESPLSVIRCSDGDIAIEPQGE